MHTITNKEAPDYLQELVQHDSETVNHSSLRSCDSNTFIKPLEPSSPNEHFFAGPAVWNALPAELRSIKSKDTFKRCHKTHYFRLAF